MTDAWTLLLGPLAAPECSRASRRGWLIWVRMFPALAAGVVAFVVLWIWWIEPADRPVSPALQRAPRSALTIIEAMMVAVALILSPAVLAGSLAGEKERGSIGLLLTTRVNSADIVLGRLAGRLSQVAMIELAALPGLLLIASMAGFGWLPTLALLALPMGVAFGGGGIALAASAMSRRGRDALLFVYSDRRPAPAQPADRQADLAVDRRPQPVRDDRPAGLGRERRARRWSPPGIWTAMGCWDWPWPPGGSGRRASPRGTTSGPASGRSGEDGSRRSTTGRCSGRSCTSSDRGRSAGPADGSAGCWSSGWPSAASASRPVRPGATFVRADPAWTDWAIQQSSFWYGNSAMFIGFLIQWAIGLRAAVTISSERERGTWDALLTSPLEGTEIVRGKLWGSLYALKWLIGSAVLAWTITFSIGGMFWPEYAEQMIGLVLIGPSWRPSACGPR